MPLPNGVTLITCTGLRPEAIQICKSFIKRQSYTGPLQWIVVDDGEQSTTEELSLPGNIVTRIRPTPYWKEGQNTLPRNLAAAIPEVAYDKILFWEDDDWYAPNYVEFMDSYLQQFQIVGESYARYYHVPSRRFRILNNVRYSAMCQTGIRSEVLPILESICKHGQKEFIDTQLWEACLAKRKLVINNKPICVGIKGLPGRTGIGIGHRPDEGGWSFDRDFSTLRNWVGSDVEIYKKFVKGRSSMADDKSPQDTGLPFEVFHWKGQTRYKCPLSWDSGAPCAFDTFELNEMYKHLQEPHNRTGMTPRKVTKLPSSLLDADGNPITYGDGSPVTNTDGSPKEFADVAFKEE